MLSLLLSLGSVPLQLIKTFVHELAIVQDLRLHFFTSLTQRFQRFRTQTGGMELSSSLVLGFSPKLDLVVSHPRRESFDDQV